MQLLLGLPSLLGGGAAATAATVAVPGIAGAATLVPAAASSGLSLGSLLSGAMTVMGVTTSVLGGLAEADKAEAAAIDAESEQALESLQGISRRSSIKAAMMDALGAQDVAYAASGVDLSFGTAGQARKDAFREADLALTTATGTEQTRISRLAERAKNYRSAAKMAAGLGVLNGLSKGIGGYLDWKDAYG